VSSLKSVFTRTSVSELQYWGSMPIPNSHRRYTDAALNSLTSELERLRRCPESQVEGAPPREVNSIGAYSLRNELRIGTKTVKQESMPTPPTIAIFSCQRL
jgi:hypothetical protein